MLDLGVRVLQAADQGRPSPRAALEALAGVGLNRVFIEGGGQVAASFLQAGLVDAVEWFRASMVIGAEGRPGIGDLALSALSDAPRLKRVDVREVGSDLWERYERI